MSVILFLGPKLLLQCFYHRDNQFEVPGHKQKSGPLKVSKNGYQIAILIMIEVGNVKTGLESGHITHT